MCGTPSMLRKLVEAGADLVMSVDRPDRPCRVYNVMQYSEHLFGNSYPSVVKEF